MTLYQRMNKGNVVYLHNYSAVKNHDIMKFAGKCMKLEKVILSNVMQTQKNKH